MKEEKIKEEKTQEVQITKKEPKQTQKKEKIIEDLPGVGAATAEKLRAVGYDNFLKIAVSSPGELIEIAGVGEPVARKMIQAARDSLEMGFQTGADLLKKRETLIRITTGSKNFDDIMGGGFETCAITECFGAYGSSKTQIAHQLAVNCQAKDPDAVAVYIDTENTFRPERIKQMAEGQKLNPEKILKNVKVALSYLALLSSLLFLRAAFGGQS